MRIKKKAPSDSDIARAFYWLKEFIGAEQWEDRKSQIEDYLDNILVPKQSRDDAKELKPISIYEDRIGWYLYLVETYLYYPHKYEPIQGARIVPIFKRIGADFEILKSISGIDDRVNKMIFSRRNDPDSGFFELTTALLWARNGWKVSFIQESPPEKKPDFKAISNTNEWYIECKRLAKSSDYSLKEREKWLSMWNAIRDLLIDNQIPFVLDIVFHVELTSLPDDFLVKELLGKLKLTTFPCSVIDNDTWSVSIDFVDFEKARAHLSNNYVKCPSDQLNELIAGRRDPNRGFTCAVLGKYGRIGEGAGNNRYLDELGFAVGAFWSCDAERAIERKARDIRAHLSSAIQQLPELSNCAIHIGLETLDGWIVEAERYARIFRTVQQFDANGKNLEWVYCHLFQPYSPPNEDWVMDETVYFFKKYQSNSEEPLRFRSMIVPDDGGLIDGMHWMKDAP